MYTLEFPFVRLWLKVRPVQTCLCEFVLWLLYVDWIADWSTSCCLISEQWKTTHNFVMCPRIVFVSERRRKGCSTMFNNQLCVQGVQKKMSHEIKKNKKNISHHSFSNIIIVCVSPISSPSNKLHFITIDHLIAEIWSI